MNGVAEPAEAGTAWETVLREIVYVTEGGSTVVYLKADSGVYRMPFSEAVLFLEPGDRIAFLKGARSESGVEEIYDLQKLN